MDLSTISAFFDQSVPIGVIVTIVYLALIKQDMKYINEKLDNHITNINKKTDELRQDMKEGFTKQNDRFDQLYSLLLKEKSKK